MVHNGSVKVLLRAAAIVLFASASMACAGLRASTLPQGPPLDVPPPPSAVNAPAEPEPEPASGVQPTPAPADAPPVRRTPRTAPLRPPAPRKTDTPDKPPEPPPAAPIKPATDSAPPAPSLQTTAKVAELEQKIRALLTGATRDLEKIDVRTLDADRRGQFDQAKRFAEQAEAALKVKNLAFAEQLADKAATLANLLVKR